MPDTTPAEKTPAETTASDLASVAKFKAAVSTAEKKHKEIQALAAKGAAYARAAGEALLDAQARFAFCRHQFGYQTWTAWSAEHIAIRRSTREFYMWVARNWNSVKNADEISQTLFRKLATELNPPIPDPVSNALDKPTTTPSGTSQPAAKTTDAVAEPVAPAPTKKPNQPAPASPPPITIAGILEALDATTKALAARPVTELATTAIAKQLEQISGSLTTLREQIRFEMDRQAEGTKQPTTGPWIQSPDANLVNLPPQANQPARTDAAVVTGG